MDIDKIQEDVGAWWQQYTKEHNVDPNIMLFIINMGKPPREQLIELIDVVLSYRASNTDYYGESVLKPKKEGDDDE